MGAMGICIPFLTCVSLLLLPHLCIPLIIPQQQRSRLLLFGVAFASKIDHEEDDENNENPWDDYPRETLPPEIQAVLLEPKEYKVPSLYVDENEDRQLKITRFLDECNVYRQSGLAKCPQWMRETHPEKLIFHEDFYPGVLDSNNFGEFSWNETLGFFRRIPGLTVREFFGIGGISVKGVPDDKLDLPLIVSFTEDERLARVNSVAVDVLEFYVQYVLDVDFQEKFYRGYDTGMPELIPGDDVREKDFEYIAGVLKKARSGELQYLDSVYKVIDYGYHDTDFICKGFWSTRALLTGGADDYDDRLMFGILLILHGLAKESLHDRLSGF